MRTGCFGAQTACGPGANSVYPRLLRLCRKGRKTLKREEEICFSNLFLQCTALGVSAVLSCTTLPLHLEEAAVLWPNSWKFRVTVTGLCFRSFQARKAKQCSPSQCTSRKKLVCLDTSPMNRLGADLLESL